MRIEDVEEIITKAIGSKLKPGDLKVVPFKFNRPTESLIGEEETGGLDFVAIAGQVSLGIMAICALLVLKMFSGAKKKAALVSATGQLPVAGETGGLLPAGTESSESSVLRRQITDSLQSNPEQAKQLFSSWLEGKGR